MPYIFGQLISAQLENSVGDPASGLTPIGRMYLDITGTANAVPKFHNGTSYVPFGSPVMTANTTNTATFNALGNNETIYNISATLTTLALTLPSVTSIGQICRYVTGHIVTIVTITGTVSIGAAVTSLSANQIIAYQAINTTGSFIRIE